MYLSAERLALANQTVKETFEQCSVAWQSIPHWDTGDPSQSMVLSDLVNPPPPPDFLALGPLQFVNFTVTLAQAISPMPDAVLARVIANTVTLAANVDNAVFPALLTGTTPTQHIPVLPTAPQLLTGLIGARAMVENGGYRAPSCLVTDTLGLETLAGITLASGIPGTDVLLPPANVNSLHRTNVLAPAADPDVRGWLLGRRQRIAHGGAAGASPGEEGVDLAVNIPPSLEVVGETSTNTIQLRVRISYAVRVKDQNALVVFRAP
ncbi:MAG: hypothetical protein P4L48_23335 [Mycobacterium sp.]|nr:hypothetical protein [Mycobacterium sp.]